MQRGLWRRRSRIAQRPRERATGEPICVQQIGGPSILERRRAPVPGFRPDREAAGGMPEGQGSRGWAGRSLAGGGELGASGQGDFPKSQMGTPGDLMGWRRQERVTGKRMNSAFTSVTSLVSGRRAPV